MKLFCVFKYYNYPKKINLFTCNDASDIDFFIDLSTFLYIYCAMYGARDFEPSHSTPNPHRILP